MNTNHCRREAQDSSLPSTRAVLIGLGLVYCLSLNAGPADAHVSYTGTTLTNGNGAFLDRETVRKDLALTVTGHAAQNATSAGVGVATGLPTDNGTFSSYSNVRSPGPATGSGSCASAAQSSRRSRARSRGRG